MFMKRILFCFFSLFFSPITNLIDTPQEYTLGNCTAEMRSSIISNVKKMCVFYLFIYLFLLFTYFCILFRIKATERMGNKLVKKICLCGACENM